MCFIYVADQKIQQTSKCAKVVSQTERNRWLHCVWGEGNLGWGRGAGTKDGV